MKLKGLILGDIRQQYKYGFYALYTLFTLVYIAVLRILPMQWKELCTTTLIFSVTLQRQRQRLHALPLMRQRMPG